MWVYPYSWVFFLGLLPAFTVRDPRLFTRVVLAFCAVEVVALSCFALVPVHMVHGPGAFPVTSFATWGLALVLWIDTPSNCLPSLHVAGATLAALTTHRVDPLVGRIAGVLALLIAASTLLVKQHYAVDVVVGGGLAWAAHRLLVAPVDLSGLPRGQLAFPRAWALAPAVLWAVGVAGLWLVYQSGWSVPAG